MSAKHTGFYYFLRHFRDNCLKNGEVLPNGLKDIKERATIEWETVVPLEVKAEYDRIALKMKQQYVKNTKNNYDQRSQSYESVLSHQEARIQSKEEECAFFDRAMSFTSVKDFLEREYLAIHLNSYGQMEDGTFMYAEIAAVKFNVAQGIIKSYHDIVRPRWSGRINFKTAAKYSRNFHGLLDVENNKEVTTRDLNYIYQKMREFIGEETTVYTISDNYQDNTSRSVVVDFIDNMNFFVQSEKSVDVRSMEELFLRSQRYCDKRQRMARTSELKNNPIDEACSFHVLEGNTKYCSLQMVKSWVLVMKNQCRRMLVL